MQQSRGYCSYSFEGEDRICLSLLRALIVSHDKECIFYIDIGSNHPIINSNTYLFYTLGFNGICIDPVPKYSKLHDIERPRDIFVSKAVSLNEGMIPLRIYDNDATSSVHEPTISRYDHKFTGIETISVECCKLHTILEQNNALDFSVPMVDIDIEGFDNIAFGQLSELPHRPHLVCVENKGVNLETGFPSTEIDKTAKSCGYSLISKTPLNSIFVNTHSKYFDWLPVGMIGASL
jgi:FkbM family methyltransferase